MDLLLAATHWSFQPNGKCGVWNLGREKPQQKSKGKFLPQGRFKGETYFIKMIIWVFNRRSAPGAGYRLGLAADTQESVWSLSSIPRLSLGNGKVSPIHWAFKCVNVSPEKQHVHLVLRLSQLLQETWPVIPSTVEINSGYRLFFFPSGSSIAPSLSSSSTVVLRALGSNPS